MKRSAHSDAVVSGCLGARGRYGTTGTPPESKGRGSIRVPGFGQDLSGPADEASLGSALQTLLPVNKDAAAFSARLWSSPLYAFRPALIRSEVRLAAGDGQRTLSAAGVAQDQGWCVQTVVIGAGSSSGGGIGGAGGRSRRATRPACSAANAFVN